jgi:hypothetical protein
MQIGLKIQLPDDSYVRKKRTKRSKDAAKHTHLDKVTLLGSYVKEKKLALMFRRRDAS